MVYKRVERGDTLVEVLLSIVILSLVIVGAITMMTRGLAAAQLALEHSEVRMEVNSQIELLRYLRDQYIANAGGPEADEWSSIVTTSNNAPAVYNSNCEVTQAKSGTAFFLRRVSGEVQRANFNPSVEPLTSAKAGEGLWVEATPSASSINPAFVDFVIRACWQGSGGAADQQRTVTAVRLYDPRPR